MAYRMAAVLALVLQAGVASAAQLAVVVSDDRGKPVADAVVTVWPSSGTARPEAAGKSVRRTIDQRNLMFVPYLQVLRPGDEVVFHNSDRTRHHVYSFSSARAFEFVLAPDQKSTPLRLDRAGAIAVGCNIHDRMIAYLYVTDAPWFARTGASGKVAFESLPAGDYDVRVWQPRLRPGKPEPHQTLSVGTAGAPGMISIRLALLPDTRQQAGRERVHY